MSKDRKLSRITRFDGWIKNHPAVVLLLTVLFVVGLVRGSIDTVNYARRGVEWWSNRDWRQQEYKHLSALHSDQTIQYFDRVLGPPEFRRVSRDGRWLELAYRRRDYWVQAIVPRRSDAQNVSFFSVTACSPDFRPTFKLMGQSLTLNKTTLASVRTDMPVYYRYFVPASVGPSFMEWLNGPHFMAYKSYAWGLNGVCGPVPPMSVFNAVDRLPHRPIGPIFKGTVSPNPKPQWQFRKLVVVNTFAEWGPSQTFVNWPTSLWIGVDEGFVFNSG
jgi:hypothetical protein